MRGYSGIRTPNTVVPNHHPSDSINQRYDKNFSGIHDKFKAAELHLQRLKNYKNDIKTIKRNPTTENRSHTMAPEFLMGQKSETHRFAIQRSKQVSKNFNVHETLTDIYKKNLNLQKKLDDIKMNGTGISFYSNGPKTPRTPSQHKLQIPKIKGPNESILITTKSPRGIGSLNFNA